MIEQKLLNDAIKTLSFCAIDASKIIDTCEQKEVVLDHVKVATENLRDMALNEHKRICEILATQPQKGILDTEKVEHYVDNAKKPLFLAIDEKEWRDALTGIYNTAVMSGIYCSMSTEQLWNHVYYGALYFLKGMEFSEVKAGTRTESLYPRY